MAGVLVPLAGAGAVSGDPAVERLFGPDRYATSLAVAQRFAEESGGALDSAVVVVGTSWTDAVVAGGLGGSLDAPVLLASPQGLSAEASAFLAEAGVTRVLAIAVAGSADESVLASVLGSLPSSVDDTELVVGAEAAATSVAVAQRIGDPGVMPSHGRTVIVASSTVFADALVAGPFAARGAHPVLLTPPEALHRDVAAFVVSSDVDHAVIMGGTAAVSAGVERELASLGLEVTRLAGATRFETAAAAADFVQSKYEATNPPCFSRSTAGLATARVPFDSFSAAPLLARLCAPLLLTDPHQLHNTTAHWLQTSTKHILIFGGPAAVSDAAASLPSARAPEFVSVDTGYDHSCGVRTDGTIQCWGSNELGQSASPSGRFTSVSVGQHFSCGIRADRTLACWGSSNDGLAEPPSGTFSSVSAGTFHACAISTGKAVEC